MPLSLAPDAQEVDSVRLALEQVQNQEPALKSSQWTRLDALCSDRQPHDQRLCAARFYIQSAVEESMATMSRKYYLRMLMLVQVFRNPRPQRNPAPKAGGSFCLLRALTISEATKERDLRQKKLP